MTTVLACAIFALMAAHVKFHLTIPWEVYLGLVALLGVFGEIFGGGRM